MSTCYNYKSVINNFYINSKINFSILDEEKINLLKEKANHLNKSFENTKTTKIDRYCKTIEKIQTAPKRKNEFNNFSTDNDTEKILLFMFSVDPNFEVFYIYSTYNTSKDIKEEIIDKFGVYDPYLIKVEKLFIKKLLTQEEQNKINEEIERRVFK